MTAITRPRDLVRWLAVVATAGIAGTLLTLPVAAPAQAAPGDASDSSITVEWATGNATVGADATATAAEVTAAQPDRSTMVDNADGSGHWNDFKDVKVTVGKTSGLGDEVIDVTVTGMAASTQTGLFLSSNFVQAMQCWGPDPNAADFYETCQYGSWVRQQGEQGGRLSRGYRSIPNAVYNSTSFPFRAVTGDVSAPELLSSGYITDGLERFFASASSNEVPMVPVTAERTARFGFETQSAISQPYLGCGDSRSAAGTRCWLVLVPRGTYSGEWDAARSTGYGCYRDSPLFGEATGEQSGSPLSPDCSFFGNRVVVPLDFDDTRPACAASSAERRIVGSESVTAAFSSWQRGLCATGDTIYSLTTNAGDLTRSQLLTGQADFAAVSRPLTPGTIGATDPGLLETADLGYAPLANTALTFGFVLADTSTQVTDLKLTPRLIAKLLTQSYRSDIPFSNDNDSESYASRPDGWDIFDDPEWQAIGNPAGPRMTGGFAFITPGPAGDDAISQLWEYVQSDADAAAFLRGEPDPWGMTLNPYYLPAGNPAAAGGGYPQDLSAEPLQTFLRIDQTLAPATPEGQEPVAGRIDSTAWNPYAGSFQNTAVRVFRFDTQRTDVWDPLANPVPGGALGGGWVSQPPALLTMARSFMGPTTAADAIAYRLPTASLAAPAAEATTKETVATARTFTTATDETTAAAVAAQTIDPATGTARLDYTALPAGAYPLTFTVNAAVDLASLRLDEAARAQYAQLLSFVADAGQQPGERPGQLPAGYTPLTDPQRAQTRALAERLGASAAVPPPGGGGNDSVRDGGGARPPGANAAPPPTPATQTTLSTAPAPAVDATGAVAAPAQTALGAALAAGAAGLLGAPFLLRRRESG